MVIGIGTISFNPFIQYGYVDVGHVFFSPCNIFSAQGSYFDSNHVHAFFGYKYACRIFFFKVTNQPP